MIILRFLFIQNERAVEAVDLDLFMHLFSFNMLHP